MMCHDLEKHKAMSHNTNIDTDFQLYLKNDDEANRNSYTFNYSAVPL